jgi:hypothetical protein
MACFWRQWFAPVLVCLGIHCWLAHSLTGALLVPTRLFALKHGATLVWGPEIVDKAILHATREVDRASLNL